MLVVNRKESISAALGHSQYRNAVASGLFRAYKILRVWNTNRSTRRYRVTVLTVSNSDFGLAGQPFLAHASRSKAIYSAFARFLNVKRELSLTNTILAAYHP